MRNLFSTCVEKSIWATETKKNPLGEFFRIWIFFYHVRVWCSGDLELQCHVHVTETNLCAGSVGACDDIGRHFRLLGNAHPITCVLLVT